MSNEELKKLEQLTKPIIDFLQENYHPNCDIIINLETVRIVETIEGIPTSHFTEI